MCSSVPLDIEGVRHGQGCSMVEDETPNLFGEPTLDDLEGWLAANPRAQRTVAAILGDLNPPKELLAEVREAILRELKTRGAL